MLLTIAVTAGVVWRATMNEQVRGRMRLAAQQTDALAADAIFELIDLRSSLHAYVAPGQGDAFWSARAQGQMASLAVRLRDLEPAATAANHPLTTALASLDGLAAVEARARASVQGLAAARGRRHHLHGSAGPHRQRGARSVGRAPGDGARHLGA